MDAKQEIDMIIRRLKLQNEISEKAVVAVEKLIKDSLLKGSEVMEKEMINLNDLVNKIEQWAKDKDLQKAKPEKQMLKVTEEIGELSGALARDNSLGMADAIGDIFITLIILCMQTGLKFDECVDYAYRQIADRKGQMVNGVFVKQEDL